MSIADKIFFLFAINKKKSTALLILLSIIFLSTCISKTTSTEPDLRGEAYAGSIQCKNCHRQVYDNYIHTAHFNTSSDSLPEIVQADFEPGRNSFEFNDSVEVTMERSAVSFFNPTIEMGKKNSRIHLILLWGLVEKRRLIYTIMIEKKCRSFLFPIL